MTEESAAASSESSPATDGGGSGPAPRAPLSPEEKKLAGVAGGALAIGLALGFGLGFAVGSPSSGGSGSSYSGDEPPSMARTPTASAPDEEGEETGPLKVVEANWVTIERVLGGSVVYQPTEAFASLSDYLSKDAAGYKVVIETRTRIDTTSGAQPKLYVEGLWVRIEDTKAKVMLPKIEVPFTGGPYLRAVSVDGEGQRFVRSFDQAQGLQSGPYVEKATTAVKKAIEPRLNAAKAKPEGAKGN